MTTPQCKIKYCERHVKTVRKTVGLTSTIAKFCPACSARLFAINLLSEDRLALSEQRTMILMERIREVRMWQKGRH